MKKNRMLNNFTKILTFLVILNFMPRTFAQPPTRMRIVNLMNLSKDDHRIEFQEGRNRPHLAEVGKLLKNKNQKLIVYGNENDLARLTFLGGGYSYNGLLLQAGPHSQRTDYRFPCVLENGFITIGWQQGKNRACQEGIFLSTQNNTKQNQQSSKVQESESVKIQPHQNSPILVQVENGDEQQQIKVIKGKVRLSTPNNSKGFVLEEGKKWNHDNATNKETIDEINSQKILKSKDMQDFLNHENWFYDDREIKPYSPIYKHIQSYIPNKNEDKKNYGWDIFIPISIPGLPPGEDVHRRREKPRIPHYDN